jgi:molybdopterin molybdotransferase
MSDIVSVTEADWLIRKNMPIFGTTRISLDSAFGRILRQRVLADKEHPPFDRVMTDGIVVAFGVDQGRRHFTRNGRLNLSIRSVADPSLCIEVSAGTRLPEGCDTVIPFEHARRDGKQFVLVEDYVPIVGQFVRLRGAEYQARALLLGAGICLGVPEIAVLATNGQARVEVAMDPGIAIVAAADDIVDVAEAGVGASDEIRQSHDLALVAALKSRGFGNIVLAPAPRALIATTAVLYGLLRTRKVVVLTGNLMIRHREYVPQALRALGVREIFNLIAPQPNGPFWFGLGPQKQAVFVMPHEPVEAMICAARFLVPALQRAVGLVGHPPPTVCLTAATHTNTDSTRFVPVKIRQGAGARTMAQPIGQPNSTDLSVLSDTDGFVQLPPGSGDAPSGTTAELFRW